MYKELNEWDVVVGIFSSNYMDGSLEISKAIQAEANGNWREASENYKHLIINDTNSTRKDFYYESFYKCYANLSEWTDISKYVREVTDDELWDKNFNQEKLLPWYILSEMCSILEGNCSKSLFANLNIWMQDKEKADYLKDKFSEELAVLSFLQNDLNASKHYTKNYFSKFLDDWSNQNTLFPKIRINKLLSFQKITDLQKYLSCKDDGLKELMEYYEKVSDLNSLSIITTEIRSLYRFRLYNFLEQRLCANNFEEFVPALKELITTTDINLVVNALEKNNHYIARKYLKKSNISDLKTLNAMGQVSVLIAKFQSNDENKINTLKTSWKKLNKETKKSSDCNVDLQIKNYQEIFKITQYIHKIFNSNKALIGFHQNDLNKLISSKIDILTDLNNYSVNNLRYSINLGENYVTKTENLKIRNALIDSYMKFVIFAQNQEKEENIYHEDIIKFVLRAMSLGSAEARQLFPCLLDLPELDTSLLDLFKSESSAVPTWMYISWIPQMLAILNTSKLCALSDIIIRIANAYPNALIYSYKLSKNNYKTSEGKHFKNLIQKLDLKLNNNLVDRFLNELSLVCVPELYLNYYLTTIYYSNNTVNTINEALNQLKKDLNNKCESSNHFKNIQHSFEEFLKRLQGKSNENEIKQSISNFIKENSKTTKANKYAHLKQCSPWLYKFHLLDCKESLEIPGQYSGERKPLVKYHGQVSSFHNKITMFSSLRKPFKLLIYGNDAKEYSFLVKFGEDLRQDQRIQQLFSLSNNFLQNNQQCRERNLHLEQFQVVPLTESLGLIKMKENTKPLSEFVTVDNELQELFFNNRNDYLKMLRILDDSKFSNWKNVTSQSKNEICRGFTQLVNAIPADILNKAFWSISINAEAYTYLRHQFITSYATMCLVHWLFGIGDRNLGNCLILQDTGRAVGIDFGFAFGTATQHLQIPELIPFRLTPHILYIMEPLKDIGYIERTMIQCLRALRKQKHILLSTMNVFVKEPSVDWLRFVKNHNNVGENSYEWLPNQKISIAKQKFLGANPAWITIEELKNNCSIDPQVLEAYCNITKGDNCNIRFKLPNENLTEEEQVQCLLDQATDYNLLGRMYHGLELWI